MNKWHYGDHRFPKFLVFGLILLFVFSSFKWVIFPLMFFVLPALFWGWKCHSDEMGKRKNDPSEKRKHSDLFEREVEII
ncbi:MAG: hypothetical protein MUF87_06600 [Anaerolineae bacterium]|nr:hypothetical protein [Anaerolineae bacterium]